MLIVISDTLGGRMGAVLSALIVIFCAIGAYASTFTMFSLILLLVLGVVGYLMKKFGYPIPPMLLGILVGKTMDTALRRALMQYATNPLDMVLRPFGLAIMAFLIIMTIFSIRTTKSTSKAATESADEFDADHGAEFAEDENA